MPASYKVDKEQRWVHTMIWGQVSLADILSALEKGLMDPEVDPNFAEIVDLTEVTRMNLSADEMYVLAQKSAFSPIARRAIVVPDNDLVSGLVRMYEILRELQGETGIRIFHTLDEALSWVAPKTLGHEDFLSPLCKVLINALIGEVGTGTSRYRQKRFLEFPQIIEDNYSIPISGGPP